MEAPYRPRGVKGVCVWLQVVPSQVQVLFRASPPIAEYPPNKTTLPILAAFRDRHTYNFPEWAFFASYSSLGKRHVCVAFRAGAMDEISLSSPVARELG